MYAVLSRFLGKADGISGAKEIYFVNKNRDGSHFAYIVNNDSFISGDNITGSYFKSIISSSGTRTVTAVKACTVCKLDINGTNDNSIASYSAGTTIASGIGSSVLGINALFVAY